MGSSTDAVVDGDPAISERVRALWQRQDRVVAEVVAGRRKSAAWLFVETIGLGPGAWQFLPEEVRRTIIFNAPTFLDVANDPSQGALDRAALIDISAPVLLTAGGRSPQDVPYTAVLHDLAAALPTVDRYTFAKAGHVPRRTHPHELADVVLAFLDDVTERRSIVAGTASGS